MVNNELVVGVETIPLFNSLCSIPKESVPLDLFKGSCSNIGGTIKRKQLDFEELSQPLTSIFCSIDVSSYAATAIVGVVNFLTTLITVFVVDKVSQIQTLPPLHVSLGWT